MTPCLFKDVLGATARNVLHIQSEEEAEKIINRQQ